LTWQGELEIQDINLESQAGVHTRHLVFGQQPALPGEKDPGVQL
jgi:hypothetical protein